MGRSPLGTDRAVRQAEGRAKPIGNRLRYTDIESFCAMDKENQILGRHAGLRPSLEIGCIGSRHQSHDNFSYALPSN